MTFFRGIGYALLTATLLWAAMTAGAYAAAKADTYPATPTACYQLYWQTLTSGSPEPHRYQPDGIVLSDGATRCRPPWWVHAAWWIGGRR